MSKYSFTFKKDNIFVDFTTSDKEAVERQFKIWVTEATEYAKTHPSKPSKKIEAKAAVSAKNTETPADSSTTSPLSAAAEPETMTQKKSKTESEPIDKEAKEEQTEVFEKASSLLKTINSIQNEENAEVETEATETKEKTEDFESVLEKTIENPTFEPVKTNDPVFLNLVNSKNTTDKFHYLMITAFYLTEFEKMDRFSLKQINSKLMQNLSEVIDHSTLQEAINQNFIELVPDLTGIAEVGEYRLTHLGEDFFANKI